MVVLTPISSRNTNGAGFSKRCHTGSARDDSRQISTTANPDLTKHTEGLTSACMNFRSRSISTTSSPTSEAPRSCAPGSFEQVLFTTVDPGQARLSDHCPVAVVFETDATIEPSDAITVLLDRLEAVQNEPEESGPGLAALRE